MVMLKALTQYQEATGDPRVIPAMQQYFAYHLAAGSERRSTNGRRSGGPTSS